MRSSSHHDCVESWSRVQAGISCSSRRCAELRVRRALRRFRLSAYHPTDSPVPATAAPPNKATPARANSGPSSTAAASMTGTTNLAISRSPVVLRMFDAPFDDAKVIVKALVGRASGTSQPRARGRLFVKLRTVCLDSKDRRDVLVGPNAELASRDVCVPETCRQRFVVGQLRIRFDEVQPGALDVSARVDLGEAGDLFACQFKHAGALPSIFRSPRRAS